MSYRTMLSALFLVASLQTGSVRADVIAPPCGYEPGCGCGEWYVPADPPCEQVPCEDCGPPQPCEMQPCSCDDWTAKPLDRMRCEGEVGPLPEMPAE